jgi:FkbM family methyltransferase
MTFVDVGANEGLYAVLASRWVGPEGRVLAVEPSRREVARLERNLHSNDLENVTLCDVALLDAPGERVLAVAEGPHAGHNTFGQLAHSGVNVLERQQTRVVTLDALLDDVGATRVDLIKIDTEGAELNVLAGAERVLRDARPTLLLEVQEDSLKHFGATAAELLAFLRDHGYVLHEFSPLGTLRPLQPGAAPSSLNVVAFPEGGAGSSVAG